MYYFRLNRNICRILPTFLANVPKNIGSASFWLNAYSQSGVSKMGDLCISSSPAESCEVLWFINPFLDPWIPWLLYGLQSFRSSWSQVPCLCAYYMGTRVNTKIAGKWGSPPQTRSQQGLQWRHDHIHTLEKRLINWRVAPPNTFCLCPQNHAEIIILDGVCQFWKMPRYM